MAQKKESLLTNKIKSFINSQEKSFVFKIHGGPMQMAGISDLIGVYKGRFLAVEVKLPSNKKGTTKLQDWFLEKINQCGGIGVVAKSVEELAVALENHNNV